MESNGCVKAIIFDLGRVLIDFDHNIAAKRISNCCGKTREQIFEIFFSSDITTRFEEGKISPQDFYLKVKQMLDLKLSYETFVSIWNDIFFLTAKNKSVYSLANSLRGRYTVMLLTNINILHHEYLKKNFPVFGIFHHVLTSYEMGAVKPSVEIYRRTLEILGVKPENAFYIDDRVELVESARKLGIKSAVFSGVEQLKIDLGRAGVCVV